MNINTGTAAREDFAEIELKAGLPPRMVVGIAIAIGAILLIGALAFMAMRQQVQSRERTLHTLDVLASVNAVLSMVKDAEKGKDQRAFQYLKSKLNSAEWFVNAIRQREGTMLNVINAIVQYQYDYFLEGDKSLLRPMILKNIAERVGVDISTVSRITCNKYVQTPFGTILLKDIFSEGIENKQGAIVSNKVIQKEIEEVIKTEDKKTPYSDQQLAAVLATKGFNIARRTVTKYREHLQIPVAQMRAFWA